MASTFLWHYWESCLVQNGQAVKHVARQPSLTLTGWPFHSWAVWRSQAIKRVDQLVLGIPKFGILLIFHNTWVTAHHVLPCQRADGARVGRSLADRAAGGLRDWCDSKAKICGLRNVWEEVVFAFCKLKKKKKLIFIPQKHPGSQMNVTASETWTGPMIKDRLHLDQKYCIRLYETFSPLTENFTSEPTDGG